ncbi:MAG: hypothetical protein ABSC37_10470 [Xanthobacteraceae bacterium]|jgi:hypothetical protein
MDAADAGTCRALEAAGMNPARHVEPLDENDTGAHARSLQGSRKTAWSGPNDDDIGTICHRYASRRNRYRIVLLWQILCPRA